MALTRQERRSRVKVILIVVGVVGAFFALQSNALLHRLPPGYAAEPPPGHWESLNWEQLHKGTWRYGHPPVLPAEVAALDGKPASVRGFLLPLHTPGKSSQFFISDRPRGCYFCNPPGVAEVIELNLAGGRELSLYGGVVTAYGIFHVATGAASDRVLYWMDEVVLVPL